MSEEKREHLRRASHCVWQIHYHMVFPVKYRKMLLERRVQEVLKETSVGIAERYEIEMEALGMDGDHVHLLCGAHPKEAPGRIVQKYKSITAREIFRHEPWVKEKLWGGEFWSDGYYVGTVGERGDWASVEAYVRKQGKPKKQLQQLMLW